MTTPWTDLSINPAVSVDFATQTAVIPLPGLALLGFTGPDSVKFLQGQATTDFREVEKGRVLRGAVCSLKGRVLFSYVAVPAGENVQLLLPADQLDATFAHLKKYSVFSKTQLTDQSGAFALLGIVGPAAAQEVKRLVGDAPSAGEVARDADGRWAIRCGSGERFLLALPPAALTAHWGELSSQHVVAAENHWWLGEIRDGLATVFAATRDQFQPQELNYHALEAVSYQKGCYTGQEVVARLYFRGKLKQRLYRFATNQQFAHEGEAVFAEGSAVGDVVMTAHDNGLLEVLAVVKNTAVKEKTLTLGENGPVLVEMDLPYELPGDKEE
jgi:folate-binding protein YgfZ